MACDGDDMMPLALVTELGVTKTNKRSKAAKQATATLEHQQHPPTADFKEVDMSASTIG